MDNSLRAARIIEKDRANIEAELSRLLMEKKFAGAPQMSAFLQYIVSQTLDGNGDRIKAYTVGVDALGKPHTFDAQSDPSVRVLALRLRKTLAVIYESDAECHVQISLKVGTYVPEFFKVVGERPTLTEVSGTQELQSRERRTLENESTTLHHEPSEFVSTSHPRTNANLSVQMQPRLSDSDLGKSGASFLGNKSTQILFFSLIVLFLLFYAKTGLHSNLHLHKLEAGLPWSATTLDSDMTVAAPATLIQTPTLYLIDDVGQSRQLRQVSMLLGSSVVQNGSLIVTRVSKARVPVEAPFGDYQLVLNELVVDGHTRIDAQVLRLPSGVVVTSSTMMFDNTTESFTSDEVNRLEELAKNISNGSGPLFKDFCTNNKVIVSALCNHDGVHKMSISNNG